MTRLTEEMVIARTRANDLGNIRKLNVWGSGLSDVTILRKMQNVEVLSLSVNKIATLADFQWCRNLQELYVRRNEIRDLNQVCYLRDLPRLRSLWLDENPCASCELYRVTVLRALPHLQKLDNVPVAPEEVQEALRRGLELCHPEDIRVSEQQYEQQNAYFQQQQQQERVDSRQQSPARQEQRSPPRRHAPSDPDSEPEAQQPGGGRRHCSEDLYYETDRRNANYEPDNTTVATGYSRTINNQYHHNMYDDTTPGSEDYSHGGGHAHAHPATAAPVAAAAAPTTPRGAGGMRSGRADTCSSDSSGSGGSGGSGMYLAARRSTAASVGARGDEEPSVRGDERERRPPVQLDLPASQRCSPAPAALSATPLQPPGAPPGSRRPVPRVWNSNILSAVLCLIKELDFPSLEVVELAVKSRMEEF